MAWYRTGTVNVSNGSTTVIGVGTGFVANSRVGDAFIGPDGKNYEITNVASDTAISIQPEYAGSTLNGQTYAIMPVQGYTKKLADEAAELINEFGQLGDLGSAAYADEVESNSDTTADRLLKVGATHAQLGADVYGRANIVGTVSQSAGVPTGAVIQRGSNVNGNFTRLADGTMINKHYWEEAFSVSTAAGPLFLSDNITVNMPSAFVDVPSFIPTAHFTSSSQFSNCSYRSISTAQCIFRAASSVARNNEIHRLSYIAVGRWFEE